MTFDFTTKYQIDSIVLCKNSTFKPDVFNVVLCRRIDKKPAKLIDTNSGMECVEECPYFSIENGVAVLSCDTGMTGYELEEE